MTSPDADDRQRFIIEGLARFGVRFNATLGMAYERFPELFDDYVEAGKRWLSSEPILGWADEAERRAHFAMETIDAGQDGLLRLAARALLAVPETSPNRDDARAKRALLRHLELGEAADDADMQVGAIDELVGNDLVEPAEALDLLARGNRLLDRTHMERVGRDFLVGVLAFNLERAIRARDAGDDAGLKMAARDAEAAHERLSHIAGDEEEHIKRVMLLAPIVEVAGDDERAAELYGRVRSDAHAKPSTAVLCARHEGRLRFGLDQDARVVEALAPIMDALADEYLTAVEKCTHCVRRRRICRTRSAILAFAYARCGKVEEAVRTLEQSKSLRLRHQLALRRHPAGARVLSLERELHALTRGVQSGVVERAVDRKIDPVAAATSIQARVLEEYRRVRSELAGEAMAPVGVAAIAAALASDEVAVLLAVGLREPSRSSSMPERVRIRSSFRRPRCSAWAIAWSTAIEGGRWRSKPVSSCSTRARELDRLLEHVDVTLGRPLAQAIDAARARRAIVVPHRMYGLVPFWALTALADFQVVVAPSAAHLCAGVGRAPRTIARALLVADPTLDLPLAPLEQECARARLEAIGIECSALSREQASEETVASAAANAELFHFAGHGKANLVQPVQSALLMHPDPGPGSYTADRLAELSAQATEWREVDEEKRWTTVPGIGRLTELRDLILDRLERSLDYGERGTLCAYYQGDELIQLAELWSAGDLMVDGALGNCELAVLSACASGAGAIGNCERARRPAGRADSRRRAGHRRHSLADWRRDDDALRRCALRAPCKRQGAVRHRLGRERHAAPSARHVARGRRGAPGRGARARRRWRRLRARRRGCASAWRRSIPVRAPLSVASFHVLGRGAVDLGIRRPGQ